MEYLGTAFAGFQRQPGKETVQGTIERAITAVTGETAAITAAGRTDAGAHARRQVIAFSTHSTLSSDTFRRALNAHLPESVAVTRVDDVPLAFHPRFDASKRTYEYFIWNRPVRSPFFAGRATHVPWYLDVDLMDDAASGLVGIRDVSAFVPAAATGDRRRLIYAASCKRDGDLVVVRLEASGFMRQMVRAIVGTLMQVGAGRRTVDDFVAITEAGRRQLAGTTAPADGLYLIDVEYPFRSDTISTPSLIDELPLNRHLFKETQ